jgi:hypothetical protein
MILRQDHTSRKTLLVIFTLTCILKMIPGTMRSTMRTIMFSFPSPLLLTETNAIPSHCIEFDLDCDAAEEELSKNVLTLYDDYIGTFWEAEDGDDLVEEITSASGWCIKSIDYRHILN